MNSRTLNIPYLEKEIKSGNREINMELIGNIRLGDILISDDDLSCEYQPMDSFSPSNLIATEDFDY